MGVDDEILTYLDTGRIAEEEGVAAIALHARTAEQLYSGSARWDAIAALKAHVTTIPVLGNGDIWEAHDALAMLAQTGCDGVVVGRGCLGRPWLFRDLVDAFAGREVQPPPRLGWVAEVMRDHAARLVDWSGEVGGMKAFRKHAGWYLTGYPVGGELRRRAGLVSTLADLDAVIDAARPRGRAGAERPAGRPGPHQRPAARAPPRGLARRPIDDPTPPDEDAEALVSGG